MTEFKNFVKSQKNYSTLKNVVKTQRFTEPKLFYSGRELLKYLTYALKHSNKDIKHMYSKFFMDKTIAIMNNTKQAYKTPDKTLKIQCLENVISDSEYIGAIIDMMIDEKFFDIKHGANIIKSLGYIESQASVWMEKIKNK